MAGAEKTIEVAVSPEQFFAVVTDYERYPEFLSEIENADVLSRDDGSTDVRFTLNLIKRLSYTLTLVENQPNEVVWSQKEGPFKRNNGSWSLEALSGDRTRATYRVEVAVKVFLPGAIVNRLVGKTLPSTLEAFKARAEALALAEGN